MANTYLPTASLSPLFTFFQFTTAGGAAALESALSAAYPTLSIQCFADGQVAGHALVVVNDQTVFSVPPNNYVGFNRSSWSQCTPAQMAGGAGSVYTAYP